MIAADTTPQLRAVPHNIDAEQALLGALLINNEHLIKVSDFLFASHFYIPLHAKIYEFMQQVIEKGIVATPITLKNYLQNDKALEDQGVAAFDYLVKLVSNSAAIINVNSLAIEIHESAIRRRIIEICEDSVNNIHSYDVVNTPMEQIEKMEALLFQLAHDGETRDNLLSLKSSVIKALAKIEAARKNNSESIGITTGFTMLDSILGGGLQDSDLVILAARPSMGKTALAINVAINAAYSLFTKKNQAVCFFSMEMSSEQIAARILAIKTSIEASRIRSAKISPEEFIKLSNIMSDIANMNLFIDDTPMLSISALRTKARRLKRQHDIGLIVVDYLQLMRGTRRQDDNRVLEIGEITNGLKAIAKELNIPILALSQLSRAVENREDKRPQLSDLRESGTIEQDADLVLMIYRPEYYLGPKMPIGDEEKFIQWQAEMDAVKNLAEIIIAKHRNGPTGTVTLHFDNSTTSFSNLDRL